MGSPRSAGARLSVRSLLSRSLKEGAMTHRLVPSDRVERKPVLRSDAERIGTIERLMIDKTTGQVVYAVLRTGGFLGLGAKQFPVPWHALKYNTACKSFEILLSEEELRNKMTENGGDDLDLGDRTPVYREPHYWTV